MYPGSTNSLGTRSKALKRSESGNRPALVRFSAFALFLLMTQILRADVRFPAGNQVSAAQTGSQGTAQPAAKPPTDAPNPNLPTLYLIGDSTVRNGQGDGSNKQWGWGEPLGGYFDKSRINVINRALGGRSSRTFLTGGQWERVRPQLKPKDVVIMQFGHNDGGALNDESRARGSIKGIGEEVEEIDNLITKQHEVVHSFGWYLRKFVADTRERGATPIICSLVPRKIWKDGKITRNATDYGGWARDVAVSEKVLFIDLNEIIAREYDQLGAEKVEELFADPHTHTSLAGAELNARAVIAGLKALKQNPLSPYFSSAANPVKAVSIP